MANYSLFAVSYVQHMQPGPTITPSCFAKNLSFLAKQIDANWRSAICDHNRQSELHIDYTYFHRARSGKVNLSIQKAEAICALINGLPGFEWVQLWMFFVPDFFENQQKMHFGENYLPAGTATAFVGDLIDGVSTMDIIHFSDNQRSQIRKFSDYLLKTKYSRPKIGQP